MIRNLDYVINLASSKFNRGMNDAMAQTSKLDGLFNKLGVTAAGVFSLQKAGDFVINSSETFAQLEALDVRLKTVTSSQASYISQSKQLDQIIRTLKLPLIETTEGFTRLAAATKGTELEGKGTIEIFKGISTGVRAMKLDKQADQINLAFEQMLSKGTVSAQELKLQLGNAMPGAFAMGAKAMGMTQKELTKELEKGNINSMEFVLRFSQLLQQEFKNKIPDTLNSGMAKITEANNEIIRSTAEAGEKTLPIHLAFLKIKITTLDLINKAITFYDQYKTKIHGVGSAVLGMLGAFAAAKILIASYTKLKYILLVAELLHMGYTEGLAKGMTKLSAAQAALNIVMGLNPVFLIIAGIGALIGLVIWAYNEFDTFRHTLDGVWAVIQDLFTGLGYLAAAALSPLRIFFNLMQGDISGAKDAMKDMMDWGKKGIGNLSNLGESYTTAYKASEKRTKEKKGKKDEPPKDGFDLTSFFSGGNGVIDELLNNLKLGNNTITPTSSGSAGSVSSGKSVRNVNITIKNLVEKFTIETTNLSSSKNDIKRMIQDALIRAVEDTEAAL